MPRLSTFALDNAEYAGKGDKFIQESMFAYIHNLEAELDNVKPEEVDLLKYSEMLQAYQLLYRQFPDSPRADFCLYKIAQIYKNGFHKSDAAAQSLKELLEKFPKSSYRSDAERMLETIAVF